MAKQTRLATTLTARYFPTAELTDAFYMDGRVTSKAVARSADLTNDKEDRGFFLSVFSHQTIPDQDPNALPPYEPVLRRLGTELKTGRRSLDDSIGEMVNTAVSITGKMKIQQDGSRAPFFAGVMVKDGEAFASTIGKGLAFLYRDDTLYPMTAADIRIDAINTNRQKVDNFYNFCATKTAPALCSNIAQLKLDDCIILCNREVYEALGQQELLRILYDAEDQSDAASVVITEAAAKLPGVPLQFMISFVEDITSSDRGGFFGFGRKKKKVVEEPDEDDYNVAPPIPMDSPKTNVDAPVPEDAMLFGDATPKAEPRDMQKVLEATMVTPVVGSAADAIASLGHETSAAGSTGEASSVEAAINTPIPEPTLTFGDISDLMNEEAGKAPAAPAVPSAPTAPVIPAPVPAPSATAPVVPAPIAPSVPVVNAGSDDDGATKVIPYVNTFDKAAAELDSKINAGEAASPFVQPTAEPAPAAKEEPFVAVKNADNPFAKAAQKAQEASVAPAAPVIEAGAAVPAAPVVPAAPAEKDDSADSGSFEVGGEATQADDGAPLFIGDEVFGGSAVPGPAVKENMAGTEQNSEAGASGAVAETDEDAPIVFEADDEEKTPMNDDPEYSNDPKEFDETPLFFGDAETPSEEKYEAADGYSADYTESAEGVDGQEAGSSDEFVIPFASNDAPSAATASADDVPEMPIYEAPTYTPPTYPTNSDTPVGYEDTGVYARGSYTVDEDEPVPSATPFVAPAATPVSPFVNDGAAYGQDAYTAPEVPQTSDSYEPSYQPEADYSEPVAESVQDQTEGGYDPYAATDAYAAQSQASTQYDFNNPPPSVADLFDVGAVGGAAASASQPQSVAAPSSVPPYMQTGESVRPGSIPGVKRPQPQRPGNRPNTQPARRRMDTIDDGFDSGEDGEGMSYLPYILAAVSVICLIIIIVLIAKSCSDGKSDKEETEVTGTPSITDVSGDVSETEDTTPPESTPEQTSEVVAADAPLGVYTFSDKSGCRTWWDLFYHVYGVKIDSETDARVTTILTYNGLDASYKPKAGDTVKLPPVSMVNS
ncbi:MAG: hypothetical protein J5379_09815 [Clostridiales bacterium]|nr:hypothetical protein [Clostridiales bacterium]